MLHLGKIGGKGSVQDLYDFLCWCEYKEQFRRAVSDNKFIFKVLKEKKRGIEEQLEDISKKLK